MFDKKDLRQYIGIVWLVAFCLLSGLLQSVLPGHEMMNKLNQLEEAVASENWPVAKLTMEEIDDMWIRNKLMIQITNGSDEVLLFTESLGEAKVLIQHEQESALGSVGAMKQAVNDFGRLFPGP